MVANRCPRREVPLTPSGLCTYQPRGKTRRDSDHDLVLALSFFAASFYLLSSGLQDVADPRRRGL